MLHPLNFLIILLPLAGNQHHVAGRGRRHRRFDRPPAIRFRHERPSYFAPRRNHVDNRLRIFTSRIVTRNGHGVRQTRRRFSHERAFAVIPIAARAEHHPKFSAAVFRGFPQRRQDFFQGVGRVGIVNDANPTSSDAILAQSQTLVLMAQQLNAGNGEALKTIIQMAQAIVRKVTPEELTAEERGVMAHFKNPAMPSVAVTSDAAIKIASSRPEFASTDIFLEMVGFDQADIQRIKTQEQRVRGQQLLLEVENDEDNGEGMA